MPGESLLSVIRALHLASTCVIGGAIAFDLLVLGRGERARAEAPDDGLRRFLRRLAAAAMGIALLSWAGWLGSVAIEMSGLPPAQALTPGVLRTVATRTTFGHAWLLRLVLLAIVAACLPAPAPHVRVGSRDALAALAATALVAALAASGHAVGTHPAHLWVDAAHLLAAALWLGMLPPLLFMVRRAFAQATPATMAAASIAVRRFSPPAMLAVIVLALTGVANAWWLVGSLHVLASTAYGVLLLTKVALFALMLLLAIANRMRWTPRLDGSMASGEPLMALRRLRRNIGAELLLGAAVLALVAVLGTKPPPSHRAVHDMGQMHDMSGMHSH